MSFSVGNPSLSLVRPNPGLPTAPKAAYGGKTGESTGIVALLKMIGDDINKDIDKCTEEEELSQVTNSQ